MTSTSPTTDRGGITQTIRALRAAGYHLHSVDDGGDENVSVKTETEAVEAIMAVDSAHLLLTRADGTGSPTVFFVLGNSPDEVICDYSMSLEHVLGPLIDSWA